jgi:hypothetical protein
MIVPAPAPVTMMHPSNIYIHDICHIATVTITTANDEGYDNLIFVSRISMFMSASFLFNLFCNLLGHFTVVSILLLPTVGHFTYFFPISTAS